MGLEKLLEETPEAYYWMGFLLADGYYYKKQKRIQLFLNSIDYEHLVRYSNFLEIDKKPEYFKSLDAYAIRKCDSKISPKIVEKFNWRDKKTYNPPDVNTILNFDIENTISLFIGFVDGDGTITQNKHYNKNFKISIVNHSSWINFLTSLCDILYNYFNFIKIIYPKITNSGYVRWNIYRRKLIIDIKNFAINKKLPILQRKWSKI